MIGELICLFLIINHFELFYGHLRNFSYVPICLEGLDSEGIKSVLMFVCMYVILMWWDWRVGTLLFWSTLEGKNI